MQTVLHIKASPRVGSYSTAAASRFLANLTSACPDLEVDLLDLWDVPLPSMDGHTIEAKYARLAGKSFSPDQVAAWKAIEETIERFDRSDRIVFSTPLWNFGIPYKLKHFIDVITQPTLSFSFSPDIGYRPLLKDRPTLVILSSAGDYRDGPSWGRPDLATPYMREALAFIGIRDVSFVAIGPTTGPNDAVNEAVDRAANNLAAMGENWESSFKALTA